MNRKRYASARSGAVAASNPFTRPLIASALVGEPGQPYVLRRPFVMLAGIALVSKLAPFLAPAVLVLVVLHALRGTRETAEACVLLVFLLLGSPGYTPDGMNVMRWVILLAGFLRLQFDAALRNRGAELGTSTFMWGLMFFAAVAVATAFLDGWYPMLSLLKVGSFFLGIYTVVTAFWRTQHLGEYWRNWMYTLAAFIIIGSFGAFLLGDAYIRTVRGMQGILTHPQIMGPMVATFTGWILGGVLSGRDRSNLSKALIAGGIILVLLSGARTAGVALGVGALVAIPALILRRERVVDFAAVSASSLMLFVTIALGLGVLMGPQIRDSVTAYVLKGDEAETASELFELSRGELIARSMNNFREQPLTGIGFGIPSDLAELDRRAESFMDIPFSASSEKGFMPSAVLEETGLIGAVLVLMLLALIAVPVLRYGSLAVIWGFTACLLTNIGAAVLFSVGGLGYFIWLFFAFCLVQAQTRPVGARALSRRRAVPFAYGGYRPYGAAPLGVSPTGD